MPDKYNNPFAVDVVPADPHNPYAAPETIDAVVRESGAELAGRWQRLFGAVIDGLTMMPGWFGASVMIYGTLGGLNSVNPGVLLILAAFLGVVGDIAWYLLLSGYLLATRGQSIGKIATGTRIVDSNTEELIPLVPLVLKRRFLPMLVFELPLVGTLFWLLNAVFIFRDNRQCLHDGFAGTKVIVAS